MRRSKAKRQGEELRERKKIKKRKIEKGKETAKGNWGIRNKGKDKTCNDVCDKGRHKRKKRGTRPMKQTKNPTSMASADTLLARLGEVRSGKRQGECEREEGLLDWSFREQIHLSVAHAWKAGLVIGHVFQQGMCIRTALMNPLGRRSSAAAESSQWMSVSIRDSSRTFGFCITTPRQCGPGKVESDERVPGFSSRGAIRSEWRAASDRDFGNRAHERMLQTIVPRYKSFGWACCCEVLEGARRRNHGSDPAEGRIVLRGLGPSKCGVPRVVSFLILRFRDGDLSRRCTRRVRAIAERQRPPRISEQFQTSAFHLFGSHHHPSCLPAQLGRRGIQNSWPDASVVKFHGPWGDKATARRRREFRQVFLERPPAKRESPRVAVGGGRRGISGPQRALGEQAMAIPYLRFRRACVQGPNAPSALRFPPRPIHPRAGGVLFEGSKLHSDEQVRMTQERIATTTPSNPAADGLSP